MMLRKLIPCSPIAVALLWATMAPAQSAAPRREPDVPFVPTTEPAVQAMMKLAGVTKTDVVYDLGCGDGRLVIAAAKTFGARAVGIDINPVRIAEAKENAKKAGVEEPRPLRRERPVRGRYPRGHRRHPVPAAGHQSEAQPKLLKDLKPGTRVVSNTFDMGEWKAGQRGHRR